MSISDFPDEPVEAQPPPGVRLDDVYLYQGSLQSGAEVVVVGEDDDTDG